MSVLFLEQVCSLIYTMNAMTTQLNLMADETGVYHGMSSHFNGDGFPGMTFKVRALGKTDYTAWLAAVRASGPVLDEAAYRQLTQQSMDVRPVTYRAAAAGLFDSIVSQKLPPGPGPASTAASSATKK